MANELPSRTKTLKVDVRAWDSLKSLKGENETFNDVIKGLLMERTRALGDSNIKVIKYQRKISFFRIAYLSKEIGFEFEYNDSKGNKSDFILDLKIKKVFYGKKILNPSEFFGADNEHKHYSKEFLMAYLEAVSLALRKEFRVHPGADLMNIALWRQLYHEYNLSEESFKDDIEEPLRLSEEEKPNAAWKKRLMDSVVNKLSKR